ncbi:hypothetical protein [Micromonospora sp. NPDC049102]|uniref:hypothetical protein n=1 Tax=Micromonospora sp. NPDC049102 TaxID=3364265 RepID=UPI00371BACED
MRAPRWAVWSIAVGGPLVVASSAAAVARWRGGAVRRGLRSARLLTGHRTPNTAQSAC